MLRSFNILRNTMLNTKTSTKTSSKINTFTKINKCNARFVSAALIEHAYFDENYNYLFWIEKIPQKQNINYFMNFMNKKSNIYKFGIKRKFIYEYGNINYIDIYDEKKEVFPLLLDEEIGLIENDKTIFSINIPMENSILIDINEDIDIASINNNPENIDNYLFTFRNYSNVEYNQFYLL